jgi:ATP-dependent RNA/DNA helicase IGHMBP2
METFLSTTFPLLNLEQTAEQNKYNSLYETKSNKQLETLGLKISHLRIDGKPRIGSLTKTIITLTRSAKFVGPEPIIQPGSIVSLKWSSNADGDKDIQGIIQSCTENSITIALSKINDFTSLLQSNIFITVQVIPDNTSLKRISNALTSFDLNSRWARIFSGNDKCRVVTTTTANTITPYEEEFYDILHDTTLNQSQQEAIIYCLQSRDVAVIHGPPGTGKTHTIARYIQAKLKRQQQQQKTRILVCAPSNVAVDNILQRVATVLSKSQSDMKLLLRIGPSAKLDPAVIHWSLDAVLSRSDYGPVLQDARNELHDKLLLLGGGGGNTNKSLPWSSRKRDISQLRKEIKSRERRAVGDIIKNTDVVFTTTIGAGQLSKLLPTNNKKQEFFDVLIIDEAAQGTMASMFVPLQFLHPQDGVLILAGDHLQLGPTVVSEEAIAGGLAKTLMDCIVELHGAKLLNTQYRMHQDICGFSSQTLYKNLLVSDISCKDWTLLTSSTLQQENNNLFPPIIFIDTAGCDDANEQLQNNDVGSKTDSSNNTNTSTTTTTTNDDEGSRCNPVEASLVALHCYKLITSNACKVDSIAVITPYSAQVSLIKNIFSKDELLRDIQVKTVDGFQGQERDAVVISMVRSNPKRNVGFLRDYRRLNVAITRARKHVCIIGDSRTLVAGDAFLAQFVTYVQNHGQVHELLVEDDLLNDALEKFPTLLATTTISTINASKPTNNSNSKKTNKKSSFSSGKNKSEQVSTIASSSMLTHVTSTNPSNSSIKKKSVQSSTVVHQFAVVQDDDPSNKKSFSAVPIAIHSDDDEVEDSTISPKQNNNNNNDDVSTTNQPIIQPPPPQATKIQPKSTNKKKKKSTSTTTTNNTNEDDELFDTIISQALKHNSTCGFENCGKHLDLIFYTCSHCKRNYCGAHRLPEVHSPNSCGNLEREKQRSNHLNTRPLSSREHLKAQERLQAKREEARKERAPKHANNNNNNNKNDPT